MTNDVEKIHEFSLSWQFVSAKGAFVAIKKYASTDRRAAKNNIPNYLKKKRPFYLFFPKKTLSLQFLSGRFDSTVICCSLTQTEVLNFYGQNFIRL